jgi:hypothetical protein
MIMADSVHLAETTRASKLGNQRGKDDTVCSIVPSPRLDWLWYEQDHQLRTMIPHQIGGPITCYG